MAPRLEREDQSKDIDFSAAGISARRKAGYADTMAMIARTPWLENADPIEGIIEYH